jgi:hypothetical protein
MPDPMDKIARINADGTVRDVVAVFNPDLPLEAFAPQGGIALLWPEGASLPAYHKNGAFLPLPPRPNDFSAWDQVAEAWVDQRTPAQISAAFRATLVCTPLQGRLVLGQAECSRLDAFLALPTTPWALREVATNALEWRRLSENMAVLGWIMGYSDEQMDALFVQAMQVQA